MKLDKDSIRKRALELISQDGHQVGTRLAHECGLSRQVANSYLQAMIQDGLVEADGITRARTYRLKTLREAEGSFPRDGLQEDVVWRNLLAAAVSDLPHNVCSIWQYVATEMINNAIDHSGSDEVRVGLQRNGLFTDVWVEDDGMGIFLHIQRELDLFDPRESILELAKGKLTTSPDRHTGEGIFFTSRMVDEFDIESGLLRFSHRRGRFDILAEAAETSGTRVTMRLLNDSDRDTQSVFNQFSDPEEFTFDKTEVPVRLAQHEGEKLVSRSQAKRLAMRFERFKRVVLDFDGISDIGQAFADEMFRVFARSHPDVHLVPINTSEEVANMVRRALGAGRE